MNLPEPRKGNMWIGAAYYYYSRLSFYMSIPSIIMIAATFWHTTGSVYVGVPLPIIILVSLIICVLIVIYEYLYATPGIMAYGNKVLKEQNPVLEEIKLINKRLDRIELFLNEVKK